MTIRPLAVLESWWTSVVLLVVSGCGPTEGQPSPADEGADMGTVSDETDGDESVDPTDSGTGGDHQDERGDFDGDTGSSESSDTGANTSEGSDPSDGSDSGDGSDPSDDGDTDTGSDTSDSSDDGDPDPPPECSELSPSTLEIEGMTPLGPVPTEYAGYGWWSRCEPSPRIMIQEVPEVYYNTWTDTMPAPFLNILAFRHWKDYWTSWIGTHEIALVAGTEFEHVSGSGSITIYENVEPEAPWPSLRFHLDVPEWGLTVSGEVPYCRNADAWVTCE